MAGALGVSLLHLPLPPPRRMHPEVSMEAAQLLLPELQALPLPPLPAPTPSFGEAGMLGTPGDSHHPTSQLQPLRCQCKQSSIAWLYVFLFHHCLTGKPVLRRTSCTSLSSNQVTSTSTGWRPE